MKRVQEAKKQAAESTQKKFENPTNKFFDIETLKKTFPEGVDPTKKEQYLSDQDFESVFKMTKAQFNELKAWKQMDAKKKVGLY